METLTDLLLQSSNALLGPVIVGLWLLAVLALLQAGGALREGLERRSRKRDTPAGYRARFEQLLTAGGEPAQQRACADSVELEMTERLGRLQLAARLGPMLGLMGTLIPLGPALMGFADGALDVLASQLVVAFGTTVIGLFIGGVCSVVLHVRRNWCARDLAWIEQRLDDAGAVIR